MRVRGSDQVWAAWYPARGALHGGLHVRVDARHIHDYTAMPSVEYLSHAFNVWRLDLSGAGTFMSYNGWLRFGNSFQSFAFDLSSRSHSCAKPSASTARRSGPEPCLISYAIRSGIEYCPSA